MWAGVGELNLAGWVPDHPACPPPRLTTRTTFGIPVTKNQWCRAVFLIVVVSLTTIEHTVVLPAIWDALALMWSHLIFIIPHLLFFTVCVTCCPACRTYEIASRFWVVVICPINKCLTVLEFSFILFDLWLFITIFNLILNYVPIITFWIFTYHKIWILFIIYCFIWNYWIIYFLACLEVFWSVVR